MAQENNSFQENILINAKQVGADQVERVLAKLLDTIERLPDAAKASQGPIRQLVELLKGVKIDTMGTKEGLGQIKAIQAAMGSLKTLASATKLFENSDLQAAQEQLKLLKQIEAQYARINRERQLESGAYGLRTTNVRDAQKQLQELQRYAATTAPAKQSAGLMTEGRKFQIEQNMMLLQKRIGALQMASIQEAAIRENAAFDKRREAAAKDASERLQALNLQGQRETEVARRNIQQRRDVELFESQNKGRLLQQMEERQQELRRRAIQQSRDMQERDQSARLDLLNQTGQRQIQYRQLQNAQAQQYQLYNMNPNRILGDAFRASDLAPQGLGRLQSINRDADGKVQAVQRDILATQKELIARTKEGNLLDGERASILNRLLDLKKKEKDLTKESGDEAAKQAAQERMLARVRGDSAAALATVQAALIANYAIINGVIGAFKGAVNTAVEYEAALKNVQAVTATSATDMKDLDQQIRNVAANSRFSAIEVANAALILGQAGLSAKQIGETLQSVTLLANASGSTLAQSVDLLTSVLGVFDKHGSDAVDVVNKITQATNDSKLTVERLALAFQYAGNTAAQAGVSFEEITAALAAMSNAGIRSGSTMGTGLRQFLVEVQKPSQDFVKAINAVGLSMDDLDFKANGFLGVVAKLRQAGFQASDAIRSFDVRGAAAFNAMLANPQAMEIEYERLTQSTAAIDANKTQMESLKAQSARLTTSLGNLVIEGLDPVLKLLGFMTGKLADVTQAVSTLGPLIAVLGTVIAGALGVRAGMFVMDLATGFMKMSGTADLLGTAVTKLGSLFTGLSTSAATATTAITGLEVSATAASLVMGGALVAAVAGLTYLGLSMWAEQSAKKIDELQAALDRARGGVQEKEEAVKSLSAKVQELAAREGMLTDGSQALKNEVEDANTRFGKWGFTMDAGTTKLQDLVREVRNLRDELRQLSLDDMNLSVAKARQLAEAKVEAAKSHFKYGFKHGGPWWTGGVGNIDPNSDTPLNNLNYLASADTLKSLRAAGMTDRQAQMLQDFAKTANSSDGSPQQLRNASSVSNMLGGLDTKKMSGGLAALVTKVAEDTRELAGKVQAANSAFSTVKQEEMTLDFKSRLSDAGKAITYKGKSLEDFLSDMTAGSPVSAARAEVGNKDALILHERTKDKVFANIASLKEVNDLIENAQGINNDVKDKLKADVQAEMRRQTTIVRENANYAMESMQIATVVGKAKDTAELRHMQSNFTLGLVNAADYANGREIIKRQQQQKFAKDSLSYSKTSKEYEALQIANEDETKDRLAKWDRDYREALKLVEQNVLKQEEDALKAAEASALAGAKRERSKASQYNTPDELMSMVDKGMAHLVEARNNELAAFDKRVDREKSKGDKNVTSAMLQAWADKRADIEEKWAKQFDTYAQSYQDVLAKSGKRLYDITRLLEARKMKMELEERASQDRLYEGDAQLRSNRVGIARATGPVSSRGVSETEAFLLQRANEPTVLESLKRSKAENEQLLLKFQESAMAADLNRVQSEAKGAEIAQKRSDLLGGRKPEELAGAEKARWVEYSAEIDILKDDAKKATAQFDQFSGKVKTLRKEIQSLDEQIAGQTPIIPTLLKDSDLIDVATLSWKSFLVSIEDLNPKKTLIDGLSQSLKGITSALGTALYNIASRTKTVKEAFADMARGIIQSMLQILSQALAMQAMKGIFKMFGWNTDFLTGGAGGGAGAASGAGIMDAGITALPPIYAATGGYFNSRGKIERVRKMANAGPITGGIPGRDSVPVLAMPGEFMVNKRAVDMVGTDFLHSLNAGVVNSAAAVAPAAPRGPQQQGGDVNVWVVTPDQVPSGMGPKDVLVTVADDISRGGTIKKLIKSVAKGEV